MLFRSDFFTRPRHNVNSLVVGRTGEVWITGNCFDVANEDALYPDILYSDIYVAKFSESGAPFYQTKLGAGEHAWTRGIAIGPDGDIWLTGETTSNKFPVTKDAIQRKYGGRNDGSAYRDGFLLKIKAL